MKPIFLFLIAGVLEIAGGYLVWLWLREHKSAVWGLLGFVFLASYGIIPVFQAVENSFGRIYAAYGAVFIALSVGWGWAIDGEKPDFLDGLGVAICMVGATIIMWPRNS
jgi:small multidrug resistance family-3 protein